MSVLTKEERAYLQGARNAAVCEGDPYGLAPLVACIDRLCGLLETSVQTKDAIRAMGEQRKELLANLDTLFPHVFTPCACCDALRVRLKALKDGGK